MTSSGKTTLAKQLAVMARARGRRVIVLDPTYEEWQADFQTADNEEFLEVFWHPEWISCDVFIDESADAIGQFDKTMFGIATKGRKNGHNCFFISQRAAQLNPTVRGQCERLFLFKIGTKDANVMAEDWVEPELANAFLLPRGTCYYSDVYADGLKTIEVFKT